MRISVPVVELEFEEGGNTIWVHGPEGATVLRIKASHKILVSRACQNVCAHSDIMVKGNIDICLPGKTIANGNKERKKLWREFKL